MTIALFSALILTVLLVTMFMGMPIAFGMGLTAVAMLLFAMGYGSLATIARVFWSGANDFIIASIPLFVLMGVLFAELGLSERLYRKLSPVLSRFLPGGMLHTNIAVGAFLAASSGSSVATTSTICLVALPQLEAEGYDRRLGVGSIAAGGSLGILIPPSLNFIIYGAMVDVSVGKLFFAGIIPGIILTFTYMFYIAVRVKLQPSLVPRYERKALPKSYYLTLLPNVMPILVVIAAVMGSMYFGIATPAESAAMGCIAVVLIGMAIRSFSWAGFKRGVAGAVRVSGMLLFIILCAKIFQYALGMGGIPDAMAKAVAAAELSKWGILAAILLLYLVLGCVMDFMSAILLTLPVTFPVMMVAGFDPIWYGIIITMLGECSLLTPPVGMGLFVIQGVRPEYPFSDIVLGCFPFFLVLLATIVLMIIFPYLATIGATWIG